MFNAQQTCVLEGRRLDCYSKTYYCLTYIFPDIEMNAFQEHSYEHMPSESSQLGF